jgi:hypothetical protein
MSNKGAARFTAELEAQLLQLHGPMIAGDDLRAALGYPSMQAFRQALCRKTVPIPVFSIEHRRGKYALVADLAQWLAAQRARVMTSPSTPNIERGPPMA